jgi:hypothetical protein
MQLITLTLFIVALFSGVQCGLFSKPEMRCIWQGLPTEESQWIAGQTVAVRYKFRYRPRRPQSYEIFLDRKLMRELRLVSARIEPNVDADGFYMATFTLPDRLASGTSYQLILRSRGVLGLFRGKIAVSPAFVITSVRKQKKLEEKAQQEAASASSSSQPLSFVAVNNTATVKTVPATQAQAFNLW